MTQLEAQLLQAVNDAFLAHDRECDQGVYLVLLNPGNRSLLGWDEVLGLPVLGDDRVPPMKVRLVCCAKVERNEPRWAGNWGSERVWWIDEQPYLEVQPDAGEPD